MMKTVAAALLLASSANALVARGNTCCFTLTASGGPGGEVGQLSDGQNRIGQGLPPATYCITDGGLTDGSGRGCILTPPTTQFQCDTGATPTTGFAIGCNDVLTYDGSSTFVACPTGDDGGYNIYETAPSGQGGCVPITLTASGCGSCPPPTTTCPTNLNGPYQFPHLIIPIDSSEPNTALGDSYDGEVSSTVSSIFDFDIPTSYSGELCSLIFLFPEQSQLQTSSYNFSGPGTIDFSMLSAPATASTDYANAPSVATDYGVVTVAPGNSYNIATFSCPAGDRIAFELKSVGGTDLEYFQDYNPSPIGLYITSCAA